VKLNPSAVTPNWASVPGIAAHELAGLAVRVMLGSPLGAAAAPLTDPAVSARAQIAAPTRCLLLRIYLSVSLMVGNAAVFDEAGSLSRCRVVRVGC
jgi:hypothetical protein